MPDIGDEVFKETLIATIFGLPILLGITIIALPFLIVSVAIDIPPGDLFKFVLAFIAAIFVVWLFSKYQIIENGIVGLVVGVLVHTNLKLHPVFCILIGVFATMLLFYVCHLKVGFWIKTIAFSLIITLIAYIIMYCGMKYFPQADNIWQITFVIIFFVENIYIRYVNQDYIETGSSEQENISNNEQLTLEDKKANTDISTVSDYSALQSPQNYRIVPYMYNPRIPNSKSAEQKIYELLDNKINKNYYYLLPHIVLRDIFQCKNIKKKNFLAYHVDFIIFDKAYYPILALEINGSDHDTKLVQKRDMEKKEFFKYHHVPLLLSDWSYPRKEDEIIEEIKNEPLITYCWKCRKAIESNERISSDIKKVTCPLCNKEIPVYSIFN